MSMIELTITVKIPMEHYGDLLELLSKWERRPNPQDLPTHTNVVTSPSGKPEVLKKLKECVICHEPFYPNSNAQKKCSACKGKPAATIKSEKSNNKDTELDETLREIDEKRKQPYRFSK